jgi:hypothetical protein
MKSRGNDDEEKKEKAPVFERQWSLMKKIMLTMTDSHHMERVAQSVVLVSEKSLTRAVDIVMKATGLKQGGEEEDE